MNTKARSLEYWQNIVGGSVIGTPEQLNAIAAHAHAADQRGDKASSWHSASQVLGTPCHCCDCRPARRII